MFFIKTIITIIIIIIIEIQIKTNVYDTHN